MLFRSARHCSSKDLFRQMPNALLARYFNARGLLPDLDFNAMPEGKPEYVFSLPHEGKPNSETRRRGARPGAVSLKAPAQAAGLAVASCRSRR